jgi:hypothetical protein
MSSIDKVDALLLDVWWPEHVLQPSTMSIGSFPFFSGRVSCICQTWKGLPRGEFWSSEDGQNIKICLIYPPDNVNALSSDIGGPGHVLLLLP